jgi:hypothetical protein
MDTDIEAVDSPAMRTTASLSGPDLVTMSTTNTKPSSDGEGHVTSIDQEDGSVPPGEDLVSLMESVRLDEESCDSEVERGELELEPGDLSFIEKGSIDSVIQVQHQIELSYLLPEFSDFLCDFGLSEPFLIDGDSLITFALSNKYLDWRNGGQFLHLVYIVENFLAKLKERGAQFEIFFMNSNNDLFEQLGQSYLLGRLVIIEHLKKCTLSNSEIKVHLVSGSWLTECGERKDEINSGGQDGLESLLSTFRPTFILSNNRFDGDKFICAAQTFFVHSQLVNGRCVIVLDNIKFEGSRVMGFLYESAGPSKASKMMQLLKKISTTHFFESNHPSDPAGESDEEDKMVVDLHSKAQDKLLPEPSFPNTSFRCA